MSVIKQIVARYPFETEEDAPSLRTHADRISRVMIKQLQARAVLAGAKIITFDFNEISYAPEIAQAMLKRQEAGARLAARRIMVDGSLDITSHAISGLKERGFEFASPAKKNTFVRNLMTILTSESSATNDTSVHMDS
eukprot:TRINITY_DN1045_c0_g2_i1.p1 TRINITY_DN1045_c0_g2~~TRINITY_DN1045_c0_g2_i1.p1  ORF type:complete len:149 (-),score=25.41 TRINITY_DN1045_c0_g2_i1:115-528(-)